MTNELSPEEQRELDEFAAHLKSLTEDDLKIVERTVFTYDDDEAGSPVVTSKVTETCLD